jgi:hypothetical protein
MIPRKIITQVLALSVVCCVAAVGAGPGGGAVAGIAPAGAAIDSAERQDSEGEQARLAETFLGFRPGEELRYTLESAEADGDEALGARSERNRMYTAWSIRLEEADGETGVFELSYEVGRVSGFADSPRGEFITILARNLATAWVNAYGFPTKVRYTSQRYTPRGGIEYTIEYRYEDERMVKELQGFDGEQKEKLDDYPWVDLSAPAGMYLFMPVDAECVGMTRQMRDALTGGGRSGGGQPPGGVPPGGAPPGGQPPVGTPPAGQPAGGAPQMWQMSGPDMEQPCQGREPVFANPGLLNLTMPALWEAGTGTIEFLAFAPTGLDLAAMMGGGPSSGGTGFTIAGMPIFGGSGPSPFGDGEDAFLPFALTAESDLLQLEVGGRTVDAFRLDASTPLDSVYVDGEGSIVRLDLPADPETGERFWIRRLRPSEY